MLTPVHTIRDGRVNNERTRPNLNHLLPRHEHYIWRECFLVLKKRKQVRHSMLIVLFYRLENHQENASVASSDADLSTRETCTGTRKFRAAKMRHLWNFITFLRRHTGPRPVTKGPLRLCFPTDKSGVNGLVQNIIPLVRYSLNEYFIDIISSFREVIARVIPPWVW